MNKTILSFTIDRVAQQHISIRVTQNHLRSNQSKLTRQGQIYKQYSKKNKPIEFCRCQRCSSIFFQSMLSFLSVSMCKTFFFFSCCVKALCVSFQKVNNYVHSVILLLLYMSCAVFFFFPSEFASCFSSWVNTHHCVKTPIFS